MTRGVVYFDDISTGLGSKSLTGKYTVHADKSLAGKYSVLLTSKSLAGKFSLLLTSKSITGKYTLQVSKSLLGKFSLLTTSTSFVGKYSIRDLLHLYERMTIDYDAGSSEIVVGETITGRTTGASGTVAGILVDSGSWVGEDAAGTITIEDITGVFADNEDLEGSITGEAVADGTAETVNPIVLSYDVQKGVEDQMWAATIQLDGYYGYNTVANYKDILITIPDHDDTDQEVFFGFIPDATHIEHTGRNKTTIKAVSHGWYLQNAVPASYRSTLSYDGDTETITYLEPSVIATALHGGVTNWNLETGCKPLYIVAPTGWGTADYPYRSWQWSPTISRWQAIQDMCDYLDYMYDIVWDGDNPGGRFCHVDDLDTYMGIPTSVTFDVDDSPQYVVDINMETRGIEKFNRVTVSGNRNTHILYFTSGTVEFTADHILLGGSSGTTATILTVVKTSGTWGSDAAGYLTLDIDLDGNFQDGETIIDQLGAGYGSATAKGTAENYEWYDYYTTDAVETAEVTAGTERPREYNIEVGEDFDTTPLMEDYRDALFSYYNTGAVVYKAVLERRADLRLWQKVNFTGFNTIPEDDMRITWINYHQDSKGVKVTLNCVVAAALKTQRAMKRLTRANTIDEIDTIVRGILNKQFKPIPFECETTNGDFATVTFDNGSVHVGRVP